MVLCFFLGDNNEDVKMIVLVVRICYILLSISFEFGDDCIVVLVFLGCFLKEEVLVGFLKLMKNYECICICGVDILMEMYEEVVCIDKYIVIVKLVKDGCVELVYYIKE